MSLVFLCSYGNEFIQEAYLYHFTRTDIKHNFSVYFYMLFVTQGSLLSRLISLMAFLPQFLLVLITAVILHRDITMCMYIQTFVFVTFNKVCTSQYFLWYLALLPLVVPFTRLNLHQAFVLASSWFIGQVSYKWMYIVGFKFFFQVLWLTPAYYLEFQGYDTYLLIWVAGLFFFGINCFIMAAMSRHHNFVPTFLNGYVNTNCYNSTFNTPSVTFR